MKKTKRNTETCRCDAYPFPHRMYGGLCEGPDSKPDPEDEGCYRFHERKDRMDAEDQFGSPRR